MYRLNCNDKNTITNIDTQDHSDRSQGVITILYKLGMQRALHEVPVKGSFFAQTKNNTSESSKTEPAHSSEAVSNNSRDVILELQNSQYHVNDNEDPTY